MTISGKSFLDLQSQMAKLKEKATSNELSSGTETSPQPIQITSSEAQTVSDALKNSKVQINPAIIKTQQTTPTAVMTAAEPTTKEEEQKIMKDNLLQQKKKVDAETKGMRVDHTNPYSMAHYVQSVGDVLTSLKTAWTTWGTQSLSDVEDKGETQLDLDYAAAQQNVNSQKEARQKFSNIYQGNYKNTNFQINLLGPQIGIKNGINTLNWMGNYPNKWITNDGSEAMMTNGTTTLSSPIIHIADYEGDMAKAYDTVTYAAAQDGVVVTPQYLKENFPGFADQPDTIVQNFIDDCLYDVQQGAKRPLEMYFDYYQGLAKSDKYVNKQDSILDAVTDDSIINNSLGYYMGGYVEMEGRTAEEWQEYVNAAYMIKARANAINNEGFNETGAGDYILAKTFADSIPELKKAIDTYDKFDIKTSEILKLESQYNQTIEDSKEFIEKVDRASIAEYNKMVRSYAHDYLDQFNQDYMNSWNAQRLQGDLWYAGSSPMQNWLWGKYYEKNGQWYDSKGNVIDEEEAANQKAFINDYLQGLGQIARKTDQLGYDFQIASEGYDKLGEKYANVAFDSINLAFVSAMNLTGMGVKFQAVTHLPIIGTVVESVFDFVMEDILGNLAMGIANMTQFAQGWDEESIQNYKEAMEGLGIMILASAKNRVLNGKDGKSGLLGKSRKRANDQAFIKAWKAAVGRFTDKIIKLEVEPAKIQDIIREKNALPKETGKKPTTRKEVEQQKKTEQKEGKEAEGEKVEGEKTEGAKKPMVTTNAVKEAISEFNRVFEEEYSKDKELSKTTFIDDLFNKARELYTQITRDRNVDIDAKLAELEKRTTETPDTMEAPKAETATTTPTEETVSLTETTPEIATQPAEQTTVSETIETAPETPGVKVEQASTKAPTDVEGKIESKEEKNIKETKTTINRILDFIQDLQNTGNEIFNKVRKLTEKSETKKAREREIQRQKDEQLLRDAGLDNESIDLVMNNPFGETLLDVINAMTKEITDKKGKIKEVQKEMDLKNNEIQRETLADGIKEIQEYVDKLIEMKNKLGKIYEELSLKREIDTYDFAESEALGNVLEGFGYKIEIRFDEETEQPYAVVSKTKDVRPKPSEEAQMKYIQDFINKQLRFEKISEADAQAIRESLKWNEDTYGKEGRSKALENSLRDAFNKFLDEQKGTDLLRKIDEGYSKIADAITDLKEILQKDNQVKDNAANKILNWDEETLNQMEELVPGIKDLVDLARRSPEIVKKGVTAKMKMKDTRRWLADPVRYTFVGLPTLIGASVGGLPGGLIGTVIGSFIFKWSENLGNKLKSKIVGKEPDLKIYNAFVDNLSLSDKEKAAYKIDALKNIEEIRKQIVGERESSFNKIMEEVNKIIIDRKAADILDQKGGTEPTTPKKPKGPDDKTPPAGEAEETMTPAEKKIVEASLGKEEGETYSPKAEKIADELLKLEKTVDDVTTDYATEKLEERGEDVTPQNIEKVKQEEVKEGGIEEFLAEMEAGEKHTVDPTEPDYRKTDLDTLIEIAEHPEKYPNVDINAVNDAIEYILQKNAMAEARDGGGMRGSDIDMGYTFAAEVDRVNGMEQRMADAKTPEAKEKLKKEWIKAKEDVIEEISQAYNIDQFEAADKFDELSNASLKTIEEGNKTKNGYKGKHRIVKAEQDKLLALMGKGPSQNITYTSSSDNIAKMENPASRKRVAEQRIKQVVDPKIEKSKIGVNKDKINRNVAKRTAEKQALEAIIEKANEELKGEQEKLDKKIELAKETKKLIDKRKNTKSREEKKELTKEIDKNEDAFDKLTYEEAGELYSKPKEVVEEEANEQAGKDEFNKAMDENETSQTTEPEMEEIDVDQFFGRRPKGEKTEPTEDRREKMRKEIEEKEGPAIKMKENGKYDIEYDSNRSPDHYMLYVYQGSRGINPKTTAGENSEFFTNKEEVAELYNTPDRPIRRDFVSVDKDKLKVVDSTMIPWSQKVDANGNPVKGRVPKGPENYVDYQIEKAKQEGYEVLILRRIADIGNRLKPNTKVEGYADDIIILEQGKTPTLTDRTDLDINKKVSSDIDSEGNKLTPEEKEEFKDSRIVNKNGELKVVMHGTPVTEMIEKFDETKAGSNTLADFKGIFFTDDTVYAEQFAHEQLEGSSAFRVKLGNRGRLYKSYINIKNPLDLNKVGGEELLQFFKEDELTSKWTKEQKLQSLNSHPQNKKFYIDMNKVEEAGYDGIIARMGKMGEGNEYIVFKGSQAKNIGEMSKEGKSTYYPKKTETKVEEKKVEEKKELGSEPLMKVESDGYVYNEPSPGDLTSKVIFERIEYIRNKAKETGKLMQKERVEFEKLKDLYKRQLEWEAREKQAEITDEELDDMYERMYTRGPVSTAGIDLTPYTD